MKMKELISHLQQVRTWERPNVALEQYPTPPDIAAHMLLAADAEEDLEDSLIADLGCGGGILGIGAALLGAGHVLCVDIDPAALSVAAENVADAELPVDLLACDVLQLSARGMAKEAGGGAASDGDRPDGEAGGAAGPSDGAHEALGRGRFDCVLMNPPFGTQKHSNGVDVAFLRAGLALCVPGGAVYSLHKSSTRAFIAKRAAEWGVSSRVVAELKFALPKMYRHQKKASLDVAVDFWRLSPPATDADGRAR